jgi:hypothetical protein
LALLYHATLPVSAAVSVVLLYVNGSNAKEGKIRLPLYAASDAPQMVSEEIYPDDDPFNVTTSEDLLDGYSIHTVCVSTKATDSVSSIATPWRCVCTTECRQ